MEPEDSLREMPNSFEGAVAGLSLSDIIQMNALNRFSGCITVQFGQNSGAIFFRGGEIIHADQGDKAGELAFYEILRWPGGTFNLQPKVTTTNITIRESWKFLLMEACRLLDETANRSQIINQPLEKETGGTKEGSGMISNISKTLTQIPGVTLAVLLGKDGIPVNDASFEAENLAAQAVNMAMIGNQLGDIFGVGAVKRAAIQGKVNHLLMFEAKNHFLSIAVQGENQLGAVEAEIRKVLSFAKIGPGGQAKATRIKFGYRFFVSMKCNEDTGWLLMFTHSTLTFPFWRRVLWAGLRAHCNFKMLQPLRSICSTSITKMHGMSSGRYNSQSLPPRTNTITICN